MAINELRDAGTKTGVDEEPSDGLGRSLLHRKCQCVQAPPRYRCGVVMRNPQKATPADYRKKQNCVVCVDLSEKKCEVCGA